MALVFWFFLISFVIAALFFLVKKTIKACAIYNQPTALPQKPNPENTIIVFDIHGVLFHHHYASMLKQFARTGLFFKVIPHLFNVHLIKTALRLVYTNAVPEAYMVGLATQFPYLKPYSSVSITIANTQIPQFSVWNIVRNLKKQGYTLHILSNIGPITFEDLRSKYPEIFSEFDAVKVASAQENYQGKPHPVIFKKYFAQHNSADKQVIFIDDKPKNIKASLQYNMAPIFFCCSTHLQQKLNLLGISDIKN